MDKPKGIPSKVTILIATFQGEQYISDALESIRNNIKDLEEHKQNIEVQVVIVDDGSTDNTEAIVMTFLHPRQNLNISYLKQNNQGQAQSFQNAIPLINGEIVLLLDSDDKFLPNKVRKVCQTFMENPECVMVTAPQLIIDESGAQTGTLSPKAAKLSTGNIIAEAKKTGSIVAPASSGLCFQTKTFKAIHPSPACGLIPCSGADSYLSLAASLKGPIVALKAPLSVYRRHPQGKFFKRLSTLQGLKTQLELQQKMERHLLLKNCINNNSYFARIDYVYSKLTQPIESVLPKLMNLCKTTLKDKHFKPKDKFLLLGFWITSFFTPKTIFWKLWLTFLKIR